MSVSFNYQTSELQNKKTPRKANTFVFPACKTNNASRQTALFEMTKCLKEKKTVQCQERRVLHTSVSIMDSKMDRLSWCALRSGRGLSESPRSVFPTARELTQQLLKGENHSIKNILCLSVLPGRIQYVFVKNGQFSTEYVKQANR